MSATAPITSPEALAEYLSTDRFKDYVRLEHITKNGDVLEAMTRENLARLVKERAAATLRTWRRYTIEIGDTLVFKIEKLDEKAFDELILAMISADKGFLIDLYRYQDSILLKAVAPAGAADADSDAKATDALAEELRALGATIPRENQLMLDHINELHKKLDALSTTAVGDTASSSRTKRIGLIKLDSHLPILKASKGENVADWFFRIENWARVRGVRPEHYMDLFFPLIQGNKYAIAKNLMRSDACWNAFRRQVESLYDPKAKQEILRIS